MPLYEKPIDTIKKTTDEISQTIKNMRVDMNIIRADIKIILERLEEKEKLEKMGGSWWVY